jgi:hypothetical protein
MILKMGVMVKVAFLRSCTNEKIPAKVLDILRAKLGCASLVLVMDS